MKNLVVILIHFILLLAVFSCAKKAPETAVVAELNDGHNSDLVEVNIENILLQQVAHGCYCEAVYEDSVKYRFTKADMLALGDVLAKEMQDRGLKLNPKIFRKMAKKTHGVDVTAPCHFSLYENRMMLYMIPGLYKPEPEYDFNIDLSESRRRFIWDVIFDPRVGLIYPASYLPELIDYAERYPEIKKAEETFVMPKVDGERIKKWSEETSLPICRVDNMNMIYHINNYALYQSRESLDWLVKNRMASLQALFVDFHMEHEPIIDSLVLVRTRSGEARLESLFAERNADGSIYIREGLLEYISQNERLKTPRFRSIIQQYVAGCFGHDVYYDRMERFPQVLLDNFTLEERRMIVAKIMDVVFPIYPGCEIDKIVKTIVENDPGFIDNAVDKNYYGLENLRMGISIYRMRFRAEHWRVISPAQEKKEDNVRRK